MDKWKTSFVVNSVQVIWRALVEWCGGDHWICHFSETWTLIAKPCQPLNLQIQSVLNLWDQNCLHCSSVHTRNLHTRSPQFVSFLELCVIYLNIYSTRWSLVREVHPPPHPLKKTFFYDGVWNKGSLVFRAQNITFKLPGKVLQIFFGIIASKMVR